MIDEWLGESDVCRCGLYQGLRVVTRVRGQRRGKMMQHSKRVGVRHVKRPGFSGGSYL